MDAIHGYLKCCICKLRSLNNVAAYCMIYHSSIRDFLSINNECHGGQTGLLSIVVHY